MKDDKVDQNDDVNDLQIAWEALECARKIYEDNKNNGEILFWPKLSFCIDTWVFKL